MPWAQQAMNTDEHIGIQMERAFRPQMHTPHTPQTQFFLSIDKMGTFTFRNGNENENENKNVQMYWNTDYDYN